MNAKLKGQNRQQQRTHALTHKPVAGQLARVTLPMLFAIIAIMGLGVVDSYFIGKLGVNELAAIGFIMPVLLMINSVALGIGMAISSINSRLIGAGDRDQASDLISDGLIVGALFALLMMLVLFAFNDTIFRLLGAESQSMPPIRDYMFMWNWSIPFAVLTLVISSVYRSLGDTKTSAIISIFVCVANMVLDPIFIFGFGVIPAMGMQGAALATLVAVLLPAVFGLSLLLLREGLLRRSLPEWSSFKRNLLRLSDIGIPAILANLIQPLSFAYIVFLAASYGVSVVAGLGVGARIEAMSFIVIYALSSTLPMFIGQNLGANKTERVHQVLKLAFRFSLVWQLLVYGALLVMAEPIAAAFTEDVQAQQLIHQYIYIILAVSGLNGIIILSNVSLNVLGKPRLALYTNLIKLCVFFVPLAYLGSELFGISGMFGGIVIGYLGTFLMARHWLNQALHMHQVAPVLVFSSRD